MSTKSSDLSASSSAHGISLSSLRRKRGNIIGHITAFTNVLKNQQQSEQPEVEILQSHLDILNETWKRFDEIQSKIEEIDEAEESRRYEIVNEYCTAIGRATSFMKQYESLTAARDDNERKTPSIPAPNAVKLPEIRLPSFDGTIENWASFFDIFSATIDRNDDLTPVRKLQYLRSTLTGKAAACIESLSTTDSNYTGAIELLKEKFDNPRRVILKHCDAIREFPKLSKDTPEALGYLVDTMNEHLRALKNLKEDITAWNSLIVSIILSKISSDTAWQWELTLKDKQMPSHKELLLFLEKRANCTPTNPHKVYTPSGRTDGAYQENLQNSSQRSVRNNAFVTTKPQPSAEQYNKRTSNGTSYNYTKPSCRICNEGQHFTWECETFHSLSLQSRLAATDKASLCHNCLRPGHTHEICERTLCRICHKNHHTLLHQPKNVRKIAKEPVSCTASANSEHDHESRYSHSQ